MISATESNIPEPRTELDSHANMVVLGSNCFVFDGIHGKTCTVEPFDPTIGTKKSVPVVDAAIAYDCQYQHKTFLFIIRNALHIPDIEHNLIPPFIMREAGLIVKDTAKIHIADPDSSDHAISFPDIDLRVPLQLWGVFSFFHSRMPTSDEIAHCDKVFITPDSSNWDPYSDHFARNEESMLDYDGNIVNRKQRKAHILDLPSISMTEDEFEYSVSSVAANAFISSDYNDMQYDHDRVNVITEELSKLQLRNEESKFKMSIGATVGYRDGSCDLFEPMFGNIDDYHAAIEATIASKPHTITPQFLSKIWNIKSDLAARTLDQTTQLNRTGGDNDLSRQFSTNDRMLRYKRINSQFFTDTFFVTAKGKSTRGNTCAQLFVSDKGYVAIYPMKSKGEFKDALHLFCKEVGVPVSLVLDPSGEQTSKHVKKFCNQVGTTLRILEEATQWADRAELYIGLIKESIKKDVNRSDCPMVIWDYCAERRARIHNVTPRDLFQLNGTNPTTATFGTQPDISNICQYDWYDWCYYREESGIQFPFQKRKLGRVLGPIKNEGNEMAQGVMNIDGRVVPRRTTSRLTEEEMSSASEQKKRDIFDKAIREKFGNSMTIPEAFVTKDDDHIDIITNEEGDEVEPAIAHEEDPVDAAGRAVLERPFTDNIIRAEVLLPQGENMKPAKVKGRAKDINGNVIGSYDDNPILNSLVYDVEFEDGVVKQYAANTIAENMYAQVDSEGFSQSLLDSIIDYKSDDSAITKDNMYIHTKSGQRRLRQSTAGWKLLVSFRDGAEQWMPLRTLKETNPVEVAEFATAHNIADEPAFRYWVPYTLRKRDRIIAAVNSRARRTTHKYGIEVPQSLDHALRLDLANDNSLWSDALNLEMPNIVTAIEIREKEQPIPVGWTKSSGHIIFDVKMDFTRKARWVKDGHKTSAPEDSTYASVVSRESVRIALTYAALNGILVMAADIKNAYLQAPSSEKHYIICGAEFGLENVGKVGLIRRALYGGKSSGADFWKHLRSCMEHLRFKPCHGDGDVWMRKAQKDDGSPYWEYVLLYVDDALCISMDAKNILENEIGKYFVMKPGSVDVPKLYLGNKVSQVTLENGVDAWSFSSSQYVQNAVSNVEEYLRRIDRSLPKRANAPFTNDYRPEIDVTSELSSQLASYYQSLIGILRWIVELGRIDITAEVSMMASCMALPRKGHLEQLFHIFAFLKKKHNTEMVFDPSIPDVDERQFEKEDWSNTVYGECVEDVPPGRPESRGFGFTIRAYVDSDHAGDSITRRSRTGFIIFLNSAPIYWTSKKQGSIGTSSFGSEFIAMKTCCEYIRGLRYKLRMMGIPCELPAYVYGDNQSVLVNSSKPFSVLKKKSSSIAYHFVREGIARDEWRVAYVNTHDNLADLLTKALAGGEKRTRFTGMVLHHIT